MSFACSPRSSARSVWIRIQSPRKNWNRFWSRRKRHSCEFHESPRIMNSTPHNFQTGSKGTSNLLHQMSNIEEDVVRLQFLALPAMVGRGIPCAPGHHQNLRNRTRVHEPCSNGRESAPSENQSRPRASFGNVLPASVPKRHSLTGCPQNAIAPVHRKRLILVEFAAFLSDLEGEKNIFSPASLVPQFVFAFLTRRRSRTQSYENNHWQPLPAFQDLPSFKIYSTENIEEPSERDQTRPKQYTRSNHEFTWHKP